MYVLRYIKWGDVCMGVCVLYGGNGVGVLYDAAHIRREREMERWVNG